MRYDGESAPFDNTGPKERNPTGGTNRQTRLRTQATGPINSIGGCRGERNTADRLASVPTVKSIAMEIMKLIRAAIKKKKPRNEENKKIKK